MSYNERDAVAAAAMQGILAGGEVSIQFASLVLGIAPEEYNPVVHWPQYIANRAYAMADALMEEGNKPRVPYTVEEAESE